jgi:hypothetical protein
MHGTSKKIKLFYQFTQKMYELDPMELKSINLLEYEPEALSILSRFSEAGIHFSESKEQAMPVATEIISDVMKFWFNSLAEQITEHFEKWYNIASILLDIYFDAWKEDE